MLMWSLRNIRNAMFDSVPSLVNRHFSRLSTSDRAIGADYENAALTGKWTIDLREEHGSQFRDDLPTEAGILTIDTSTRA